MVIYRQKNTSARSAKPLPHKISDARAAMATLMHKRPFFFSTSIGAILISAVIAPALDANLTAFAAPAENEAFTGAWRLALCDRRNPEIECGEFSLTLRQHGDTICGSRFIITPGLAQQDEDEAGSVIGSVAGSTATLVIKSSRTGASYLAKATRVGSKLSWKIIAPFTQGRDGESPLFPFEATLLPSTSTQQQQMLNELASICRWPQEIPEG